MRAQCQDDKTSVKFVCNRLPPKARGSSKVRGEVLCKLITETNGAWREKRLLSTIEDLLQFFKGRSAPLDMIWPKYGCQDFTLHIHIDNSTKPQKLHRGSMSKNQCHSHEDIHSGSMTWLGWHSHIPDTKWIYELDKFQPSLGSKDFTGHPRVFKTPTYDMIPSMWLQFLEVEHGRNHLITGHWCELLTNARRITIDDDDLQDISTHFIECE